MSVTNIITQAGNVQGIIGSVTNFAQSVLSMFGVDVVGVFDNTTYDQIFQTARPMKANVSVTKKIMDHPVESGALISDFAIILPVEIELSLLLTGTEYQSTYQLIKAYFDSGALVSVTLRSRTFNNMLIQAMPHEESPDQIDVLPLALKLREVQMFTAQYQALAPQQVATPTDESTVSRGAQQPQSSILYNVSNYVSGIFK